MFKFERRERKLLNKKRRLPKHGKELSDIYRNSIEKRQKKGNTYTA